jgi:hypothetical protein
MPRMQPPPGYMTAKEARARLNNISDTLLRRHVEKGELNRYGPVGRSQKPWYKESEVEALYHTLNLLEIGYVKGGYKNNPTTSFEVAKEEDMPSIIDIDTRTFKHPAASLEVCLSWQRKNPHTFYVLKNEAGVVRAYASLIPLDSLVIDRFIHEELDGEDITAEMIHEYVSGEPVDIYVMGIAVDPDCSPVEKNTYGGNIVRGLFNFLLTLAHRGVEIRRIVARNYMKKGELELRDGLNLLRKIGFTQLRSSVPGVGLFVVNVPESGIGIFEKYSKVLEDWKTHHKENHMRPFSDVLHMWDQYDDRVLLDWQWMYERLLRNCAGSVHAEYILQDWKAITCLLQNRHLA